MDGVDHHQGLVLSNTYKKRFPVYLKQIFNF